MKSVNWRVINFTLGCLIVFFSFYESYTITTIHVLCLSSKKKKRKQEETNAWWFFFHASYSLNAVFALCDCVNGAVISLYRTVRRAQSERVLINRFYYIISFNTLYIVHMGNTYNSDVFIILSNVFLHLRFILQHHFPYSLNFFIFSILKFFLHLIMCFVLA